MIGVGGSGRESGGSGGVGVTAALVSLLGVDLHRLSSLSVGQMPPRMCPFILHHIIHGNTIFRVFCSIRCNTSLFISNTIGFSFHLFFFTS